MGRIIETIICVLILVFIMAVSLRTAKRPGISVGMGITNKAAVIFFYGYMIAECFVSGGWKVKWIIPAAFLIVFLSFAVAWIWVKKTRVKLSIKKDVKPNDYIIDFCEKLVVITSTEDLLDGANVRKVWFDFLLANAKKFAKEKHLTALVLGKYYVIPFQKFVADKIDKTKYEECICLVWSKKMPALGWKNIEQRLERMEKDGFKIILCENSKITSKRALYSKWPVYANVDLVIPYEIVEHYDTQKRMKQNYLKMHQFLEKSPNQKLQKYIDKLCMGESLEEQFYTLLKIAECCGEEKEIDITHRSMVGVVDEERLSTLAEEVLQLLMKEPQISEKTVAEKENVKIVTCLGNKEYKNLRKEQKADTDEDTAKKKIDFLIKYKRASAWSLYGNEDNFRGWSKGLNGKYMTKSRFDKDYAEKILKEEPVPEAYHDLLMKLETNQVIHLLDGEAWDAMHKSWFSSIKIEEAYISNLMMEGEFLPMSPVKVALLHKDKYEMNNLFSWINSLEIREFKEREELIKWIRHDSVETGAFAERVKTYRKALKDMGCESVFLNSNSYFVGLFKNAFDHRDTTTSALSFLDFMEFAMLNVQYVLMEMEGTEVAEEVETPDFEHMGNYIFEHAKERSVLYERTHYGVITIPEECQNLHKRLQKYLSCEITGAEMDFQSLIQILHQIRLATKNQLIFEKEYIEILWNLLLYYSIMFNRFLDLYNFGIRVDNTKIWAGYIEGYEDGYIRTRKYFVQNEGVPCPVWEIKKGEKKYINYFYKKYVTSEEVEEDAK